MVFFIYSNLVYIFEILEWNVEFIVNLILKKLFLYIFNVIECVTSVWIIIKGYCKCCGYSYSCSDEKKLICKWLSLSKLISFLILF